MAKRYGYRLDATHQAIIFERGSAASSSDTHIGTTPGMVVGTSEWGWITKDNAKRICAALTFFSETPTEEIIRLANERFPEQN